jgi:hypothetical protein
MLIVFVPFIYSVRIPYFVLNDKSARKFISPWYWQKDVSSIHLTLYVRFSDTTKCPVEFSVTGTKIRYMVLTQSGKEA